MVSTTVSNSSDQSGLTLRRCVLDAAQLEARRTSIEAKYLAIAQARQQAGLAAASQIFAPGQRSFPTASSFTLGSVLSDGELGELLAVISAGPAGGWIRNELEGPVACDLDQAWVRRQYAPSHSPPLHSPHGWHQDGALGFDFMAARDDSLLAEGLLSMVTCWIALDRCGRDAPGLELVHRRLNGLLRPVELSDERVRERFRSEEFWRPAIEAGDGLLFRGDILHRTYVTAQMTDDRTSLELRFFPREKLPRRLAGDRFLALD
jgi:phytanoyl-CoA dioxygenase PhyH